MKENRLIFKQKIQRTSSIISFRFTPAEKIDFIPGQFLNIMFDEQNKTNPELNKYLSISNSPSKDYIEVTKRISNSAFSQRLLELKTGDRIIGKGPFGNCVMKNEDKKIAFLSGGIGITPIISMIEHITEHKLLTDVILLFSNKREDDIPFRKELDAMRKSAARLSIIYTITECQPKDPACVSGVISKELIINRIPDMNERIIFIFGPPPLVEALQQLCVDIGCAKDHIRIERFFGY